VISVPISVTKKKIIIGTILLLGFIVFLSLLLRILNVRSDRLYAEANMPDRDFIVEIDRSMIDSSLTFPVFTDDLDTPFIIEFRKRYEATAYFRNSIVNAAVNDCENRIKHAIPCTKKDVENIYKLAVRGDLFSLAVFPRLRNDTEIPLFPLLMESARKGEVTSLILLVRFHTISGLELDAKALEEYAIKIIENRDEPIAYEALSLLYAKQGRMEEFCDTERKGYALFGLRSAGSYFVNESKLFDGCGIFDNTKTKDEILQEINTPYAKILLAYRQMLLQINIPEALAIFDEVLTSDGEITDSAVTAEFCKGILLYMTTPQKELGMQLIKDSYDKGYTSAYLFIPEEMKQTPVVMPKVYEINMVRPAICNLAFDTEGRTVAKGALKGAKEKDFQKWFKEGY
jgi:tetratricopeptide (TPR) repeat protein